MTQQVKQSQEKNIEKHSQILSYIETLCETKINNDEQTHKQPAHGPIFFGTIMGTSAGKNFAAIAQAATPAKHLGSRLKGNTSTQY
jgi:hypothetical protein